ncbi:uncharacterized protein M421DRAFT_408481 [Didymella exigua CBS 183.55]|uniref:F-box domain-containing protein n=1 Tax=Didymella exigua CBS 183.55 TaxID=1150837 RepID=A0A6A5RV82_9PLEO|nr:uncharacterized protein M421DRAFT_408481 [Didymella exigua CBS 183.55]KAF1931074.1 hypothetical protein M421DRAFT_408481 [Didymella exigua CBS 183.55]
MATFKLRDEGRKSCSNVLQTAQPHTGTAALQGVQPYNGELHSPHMANTTITNDDFPPLPFQTSQTRSSKNKKVAIKKPHPKPTGHYATLDDLPDELTLEIINYLPGIDMQDFQLRTLLSLSRSTRNLHRVVSDKIYSTYDSYFCEPYLFLRTLISNPRLGESVRHAKFRYGADAHLERKRYSPTARDKKIIKEGTKSLNFPDWKGWATRCNSADVELDILHTAVMLHTPNLMTLDVEDGVISAYSKAKWPELIKKATTGEHFGQAHQFSALKSVRVDAQNMVIHHLVPILRLPSLRKLELRELSEIELDMRAPAELKRVLPQGCNNLEDLVLEDCSLRCDALETLISSARSLKSFRFDASQDSVHLDGSGVQFLNVLRRQKNCLESLDIYHDPWYKDDEDPLRHGGLEQFPVLKDLKCPLRMVIDVRSGARATALEFLPPALETLCLSVRWDADEELFLSVLERMASEYATTVPRLELLQLNIQVPAEDLEYDCERLVKAYSTTGVDLVINLPSDSDDDEWGGWLTVPSDSDDSSDDSDEVELYSNNDDSSESDSEAGVN